MRTIKEIKERPDKDGMLWQEVNSVGDNLRVCGIFLATSLFASNK